MRKTWNNATHTKPSRPVTTKEARQPQCRVTNATSGGAIIAPRLDPLLQIPITMVRAAGGTQVAAAFAKAGHAPPSPTASSPRKNARLHGPRAKAVSAPAIDHHVTASERPRLVPRRSRAHPAIGYAIAYT